MTVVFADTFYFLALLNSGDEAHAVARQFAVDKSARLLTTTWVLTELADGLAETRGRTIIVPLIRELERNPQAEVIPPESSLWQRAIELYDRRPDKGWSLTDCISFVTMKDRSINDALTGDHHFEQAGFRALLK